MGFSVKFDDTGVNANKSDGIHLSANLGKLLYTNPASSPATNAPTISNYNKKLKKAICISSHNIILNCIKSLKYFVHIFSTI